MSTRFERVFKLYDISKKKSYCVAPTIQSTLKTLPFILADVPSRIDSICGSLSTVFVTISGPPVTKTVTVPFETPSTIISNNVVPINSSISSGSSINITTKLTEYITILRTVTTSHAISKSVGANQGRYTFTESDGSTFWFGGKTPPAGVPLVTSTATITIQPTPPSSGVSTRGTEENTSYTTVFLTVVSRKYEVLSLTKTAIASTTAVVPSIAPTTSTISTRLTVTAPLTATVSSVPTIFQKLFSGNRSNGWNNTLTIGLKEKVADVGTEPVKPSPQQSSAKEYHDARPGIASLAGTYANATKDLEARQLGSIVVATINGVVVSWTNNYDGAAAVTPAPVSVESNAPSRKAIVTPSEYDMSNTPRPRLTICEAPERIEVPIYPWDLQPIPIQVFPIISPEPTVVSSVQQLPTRSSVPHHQHSTSTDFQETLVVTLSSVQQTEPATSSARSLTSSLIKTRTLTKQLSLASISHKHPISNLSKLPSAVQTKIVTSVKPIRSSHKASSTKTSTLGGVDSITTHTATSATPSSCAGNKAEFIIDVRSLLFESSQRLLT